MVRLLGHLLLEDVVGEQLLLGGLGGDVCDGGGDGAGDLAGAQVVRDVVFGVEVGGEGGGAGEGGCYGDWRTFSVSLAQGWDI